MRSKSMVPMAVMLSAVSAGACGSESDPEPVSLSARVGEQLTLPVESEFQYIDDVEADWIVADAPEGSLKSITRIDSLTGILDADRRGRFVVDRWLLVGASERWSHRYYVDVANAPPIATIDGDTGGDVGFPTTVSGLTSFDSEKTSSELRYSWRLAYRPWDSNASLETERTPTVTLVPDIAGQYTIELSVFDGELWSTEEASQDVLVVE